MIITTRSTTNRRLRSRRGFTLTEVLVASTLSVFLMLGVMSSIIFLMKHGYRTANYSSMETQSRKGLETFARDVRMAKGITWNSTTQITLVIPTSGTDATYTYQYNATAGTFSRTDTSSGAVVTLISGITASTFSLQGYKLTTDPTTHYPYAVDLTNLSQASVDTKQLQLTLAVNRGQATLVDATNNVISARFILRNKHITS